MLNYLKNMFKLCQKYVTFKHIMCKISAKNMFDSCFNRHFPLSGLPSRFASNKAAGDFSHVFAYRLIHLHSALMDIALFELRFQANGPQP